MEQHFVSSQHKEILDIELMITIIENSKMVYDLIDSIDVALKHFHEIGKCHARTKA